MDAALELFSRDGYYSTPISKIARRAGISKGLLYNYFKSKEDLVMSIVEIGVKGLMEHFDPDKDGELTADEFDFFVDKSFELLVENTTYWRLYFNILMQADVYSLVRPKFEVFMTETFSLLTTYYEKRGITDPTTEAMMFGAVMDGVSMQYLLDPDNYPLEAIKQRIIEKFGHKMADGGTN